MNNYTTYEDAFIFLYPPDQPTILRTTKTEISLRNDSNLVNQFAHELKEYQLILQNHRHFKELIIYTVWDHLSSYDRDLNRQLIFKVIVYVHQNGVINFLLKSASQINKIPYQTFGDDMIYISYMNIIYYKMLKETYSYLPSWKLITGKKRKLIIELIGCMALNY